MYPRLRVDGSACFITSNIQGRLPVLESPSFAIPILDSLNFYRHQYRCRLFGYVIMPDHVHLLIHPMEESSAVSDFMRDFKRFTSGRISRQAELEGKKDWLSAFQASGQGTGRAEKKVWQDSFWDQVILSDKFIREKLNYMHMNPVRAGLVDDPVRYPYSSCRNYECDDNTLIEIDKDWI